MTLTSLGDMSQAFITRRQNVTLRTALNELTNELASGKVSDVSRHVGGDFTNLASIERTLAGLESYKLIRSETTVTFERSQLILDTIHDSSVDLTTRALAIDLTSQTSDVTRLSSDAMEQFRSTVALMNTQLNGDALFAGVATNDQALAEPDVMMADIALAVVGLTDPVDVIAAVEAWFDTPAGGFETVGYLGSTQSLADRQIGENVSVSFELRADDTAIRDVLKASALAALVNEGVLAGDASGQADMIVAAGEVFANATAAIVDVQAGIGGDEARIEAEATRLSAQASSLQILRNEIIGADPFDTATRLEEAQLQLETHYTLTARLSRLSLMDYL